MQIFYDLLATIFGTELTHANGWYTLWLNYDLNLMVLISSSFHW